MEVKQLAMYWNLRSHPLSASAEAAEKQIISFSRTKDDTPDKVYLLRPTDLTLKLLVYSLFSDTLISFQSYHFVRFRVIPVYPFFKTIDFCKINLIKFLVVYL